MAGTIRMNYERPATANPFRPKDPIFPTNRPLSPSEAAREQRSRKEGRVQRSETEHLHTLVDLQTYLKIRGHAEACDNAFSCDPWKYEPILLDDLIKERLRADDPEKMNELRGLIRAGSWPTYPRLTDTSELETCFAAVREQEDIAWNRKAREADPDTSKELKESLTEIEENIDKIRRAIDDRVVGDGLEEATRHIEDICARLWLELKELAATHGLSMKETRTNYLTKPYHEEIEQTRPIRDLLYLRRLYPKLAERSIESRTSKTRKSPVM